MQGTTESGVAVFRGVPYAAAPVGPLRFGLPQPAPAWTGVRDATRHGPIAPQLPSRLRLAMGDFTREQSEDCLTLTIWTPAADTRRRPVLAFFHGGAFLSGAGSLDFYSGAVMARRGEMVVVGVNHRLGVLGFMALDGVSPPNLGLHDQIAALEWVHRHIADFGGDPDNITIAGQSAGGTTLLAMLAVPRARGCFRRGIVQSVPAERILRSPADARRLGEAMQAQLGIESRMEWQAARWQDILAAQLKIMTAEAKFADPAPPFTPVADGRLLGDALVSSAIAGACERDLMIGYTRDEMLAFYAVDERVRQCTAEQLQAKAAEYFGAAGPEAIEQYRRRAAGSGARGAPCDLLAAMMADTSFAGCAHTLVERLAALGRAPYLYRFDWAAPGNAFGACHCIELPFMFNNLDQWDAPMLAGGDDAVIARLAEHVQDCWIAFARTGDPSHDGVGRWPAYTLQGRETMLFDVKCAVRSDPGLRGSQRYWP